DMAMDGRVGWHVGAQVLQLGLLLVARAGDTPLAVAGDTLFQRGIVAPATCPQDIFKLMHRFGRRPEVVLGGLVQALLFHVSISVPCGWQKPKKRRGIKLYSVTTF